VMCTLAGIMVNEGVGLITKKQLFHADPDGSTAFWIVALQHTQKQPEKTSASRATVWIVAGSWAAAPATSTSHHTEDRERSTAVAEARAACNARHKNKATRRTQGQREDLRHLKR